MKTSIVTALFALAAVGSMAMAACSSDNSNNVVTSGAGTVPDGQPCSSTADCEEPLSCGFPVQGDAGVCPSKGVCVAMGSVSVIQACSCGSPSTQITVSWNSVYVTPQPINTTATCGVASPEGGTTTPPADSGSTAPPADSGSGGSKTGG
jgi:hypothetical protein